MNPITASVWIDAVPEEVFAIATNFGECANWLSGVTEARVHTPGPVGVGTKFTETRRDAAMEMTVSAFVPPRSYTLQCDSNGVGCSTVLMFEADRGGTIVSMDVQLQPKSFVAKLMSPAMGMMSRKMRKHLVQDLHDLKAAAEKTGAMAAGR
jgi:carbon monoxide dehydrogenase subunit G